MRSASAQASRISCHGVLPLVRSSLQGSRPRVRLQPGSADHVAELAILLHQRVLELLRHPERRQQVPPRSGTWLVPRTVASYWKNVRLHITPYLGTVSLASLTSARLTALDRELEASGRADHKAGTGLSARTC